MATWPNSNELMPEVKETEVQSTPGVAVKRTDMVPALVSVGVSPASNPLPGLKETEPLGPLKVMVLTASGEPQRSSKLVMPPAKEAVMLAPDSV